ncbi:MAG: hypothetical protein R3253_07075 [Longimicrobiales bacterium]|nr:hypothetical protein [Longimicrobiales bacterium]
MTEVRDGTTADGGYEIRPFESTADYRACVDLQEATWGDGFSERVSPAILKVSQILGGVAAGAYDDGGALVGFVFGLTGVRDGRMVHWSDMLAVRPGLRDSGLGRRLKAYQREDLLSRGIDTMYWTFDPLQSRNAHLNITRLGAVVREYRVNMYGESDSPLHRGIGTDRFVALWLMDSERVRRRLQRLDAPSARSSSHSDARSADPDASSAHASSDADPSARGASRFEDAPSALSAREGAAGPHPQPGLPDMGHLGNDAVRVSIPFDVGTLMEDDMELAVEWREATRTVFDGYMSAGFQVLEFKRGRPVSTYLLSRIEKDGP